MTYFDRNTDHDHGATTAVPVGTIYRSMWGYEQTNVDYYEVVKATAKTATLRQIATETIRAAGQMAEYVVPSPGEYVGEPFRRKVRPGESMVSINSVAVAAVWTGSETLKTSWH